jgi:hypothetical protein
MAALLSVQNIQTATATITLNTQTVYKLNAYAAFTTSTPDAVIVAALDYVFAKDKEFDAYLTTHKDHPQLLRIQPVKTQQKRRKSGSANPPEVSSTTKKSG